MNSRRTGWRLRSRRTTTACAPELLERLVDLFAPLARHVVVLLFPSLLPVVNCAEYGATDILSDSYAPQLFIQERK
jgi:hypothetical protein